MGFFDRNRKALIAKGIDPARLPPGQYSTDRFPVLHVGEVPTYRDLSTWSLRIFGAVDQEVSHGWDELLALGSVDITVDIHCVTTWSKLDTRWYGVPMSWLLEQVAPLPSATHVVAHGEQGYTANVPLDALRAPGCMLGYRFDGQELEPAHGYPLRLVVPQLYFWKSTKWLRGLEFLEHDAPGYWEVRGYSNTADPWREERYGF